MSCYDCDNDESKKVVAVVVGLLIGGMLVWAFSGPAPERTDIPEERTDRAEDACLAAGGIPLYNDIGRVEDCKKI